MAAVATIKDQEHRVTYLGNPLTDAAQRNSLTAEGPLLVSNENVLVQACAKFMEKQTGGYKTSMHFMQYLFTESFVFTQDLIRHDLGFAVGADALSQLIAEFDESSFAWTAVDDPNTLRARLTAHARANIALNLRLLSPAECHVQKCDTDTFYDHLKVRSLLLAPSCASDEKQDLSGLRQFRGYMTGGFNEADRTTERFRGLIMTFESSLPAGKRGSEVLDLSIAAHASAFHKFTRPPPLMDMFVDFDDGLDEIARRGLDESERFQPLFDQLWRRYINISEAFPRECTGAMAFSYLQTLAAAWKVTASTSEALVNALELALVDAIAAVDSVTLKKASNADRLAAFTAADVNVFHSKGSRSSADAGSGGITSDSDEFKILLADRNFKDLTEKLVPNCNPVDNAKLFTALAGADHAAGLIYLNGKNIPNDVWRKLSGARSKLIWSEVFLAALQTDESGERHSDWEINFDEQVPIRLVEANFSCGDGKKKTIHLYNQLIEPCVRRRKGAHVLAEYTRFKTEECDAIFTDAQLMRYAEPIVIIAFELIGYTGKSKSSLRAAWRGLINRAQDVAGMPQGYPAIKNLKEKLRKAGRLMFSCASEARRDVLGTPLGMATMTHDWAPDGSKGMGALIEFDTQYALVLEDLERAEVGAGRTAGAPGASDLVNYNYSNTDAQYSSTDTRMVVTGGKGSQPTGQQLREHQNSDKDGKKRAAMQAAGAAGGWGNAAFEHGIFRGPDGFCFGNLYVKCSKSYTLGQHGCPAQAGPTKTSEQRSVWHKPDCKCSTVEDHARPEGTTDEDFKITQISNEARADFEVIYAPAVTPSPKKGKGDGKGKGKGKGRGGKGGRGKGRQSLNKWQS